MSWKLEEAGDDAVTLRREDGLVLSARAVAARETRADHQWTEWTFAVEDGETGARATQHGWEIVDEEHLWEVLDAFTYRFRPGADHPEPDETVEPTDEPESDDGEVHPENEESRVDEVKSPKPAGGMDSVDDSEPIDESHLDDEPTTDEDGEPVTESEMEGARDSRDSDDPSSTIGTEPDADPEHIDEEGAVEERTSTIGDVIVDDLGPGPESESADDAPSTGKESRTDDQGSDAEEPDTETSSVDEPGDRSVGIVIDRPGSAASGDESETSPTADSPNHDRADGHEPASRAEPPADAPESEPLDETNAGQEKSADVDVGLAEHDGAESDELAKAEGDEMHAQGPTTSSGLDREPASDVESTPDVEVADQNDEQPVDVDEEAASDEPDRAAEADTTDDGESLDEGTTPGDEVVPDDDTRPDETASTTEPDGLESDDRTERRADTDGGTTARPATTGAKGRAGRPRDGPTVTIREATPADADRLAEIYRNAYAENRNLGLPAKAESATAAMVSAWIDANGVIVASVGDTVVGGVRLEVTDPGRVKVSRLGVHETWKGKGIGSRLLAAAEAAVEAGSAETIWLTTPPDHPYLPDMYRDRGYEQAGEYPLEYRDYDEVVFEKRVTREDLDEE